MPDYIAEVIAHATSSENLGGDLPQRTQDVVSKRRRSLQTVHRQFSALFTSGLVRSTTSSSLSLSSGSLASPSISTPGTPSSSRTPVLGEARWRTAAQQIMKINRGITAFTPTAIKVLKDAINENPNGPMGDLTIIRTVGVGAFGTVSLVKHDRVKIDLALKVLEKDQSPIVQEQFDNEKAFSDVVVDDHPRLVKLLATWEDSTNFYMLMDYCSGGDLFHLISDHEIDEETTRILLTQAALAIHAVHKLSYAHRDVKPDNFLLDSRGQLKLCDFGFCAPLSNGDKVTCTRSVGTPQYVAPEVINALQRAEPYSSKCDWWSYGIVAYELFFSFTPFSDPSVLKTHMLIRDHQHYFRFPKQAKISKEFRELIEQLVCTDDKRIGFDQIKSHAFFASTNWPAFEQGLDSFELRLVKREGPKPTPPMLPPPPVRAPPRFPPPMPVFD